MKTLLLSLLLCGAVSVQAREYNVRDYGAVGDGHTIDSPAINAAIQAAADAGGGTVVLPAGTYASYSVRLQSGITLRLMQDAVLLAAEPVDGVGFDEPENYDWAYYQDFGHSHFRNSLIWGIGLHDIAIEGQGLIDGSSMESHRAGMDSHGVGNKGIALMECINVRLQDFSMLRCAHFALLATGCDDMQIRDITVDTNRDGLDIDACHRVSITGCTVNTPHDDAIVLKASYALGRFRDCEDIEVSDCHVSGYDCGTWLDGTHQLIGPKAPDRGGRTGRIKLGTESSGGYRRISIHDCTFEHCRGLALETVDGGHLEDVHVANITMHHIVNAAIFLRLGARLRSPEGTPVGTLRNVTIEHIRAYDVDSRYSSIIAGIPDHCIEDVTLRDIELHYRGGCTLTDREPVIEQAPWEKPGYKEPQHTAGHNEAAPSPDEQEKMRREMEAWRNTERDTALVCNLSYPVPEVIASYPEPWMFGIVPASGFYIRHVRRLTMEDIRISFDKPDARPLYVREDAD